ncbi:succinyldiaminopimelate transaminase [Phytoactinopolyspora alkaliphila]|nr:succinyldiaminopimelate transaminase [Phytoactinopolyspora alkaliphila]
MNLPAFPWDSLVPYRERAREHPDGLVDLSVGTPVDATPRVVREALAGAANSPGYPTTLGTEALRASAAGWLRRRFGIETVDPVHGVLPCVGSKELVAWLPTLLGLGKADVVVHPELAYPTYGIGALMAGAEAVAADSVVALGPRRPRVIWVNSPANPDGRILPAEHLAKMVAWARECGAVLVADECYIEFGWDAKPVSVLDPAVNGGSLDGVLAVHSLSKRSNLAGYRAGFVAGDPDMLATLLEIRKHAGMLMPGPVQAAMAAALDDDAHVDEQLARYRARRELLRDALVGAGLRIDRSEGSLYLWATRDEPCWETIAWLADQGILAAPGEYYGPLGASHVRVALTATDERVAAASKRLRPASHQMIM